MFRLPVGKLKLWTGIALVGAALLLVLLAEIHACACTGGPPVWHSVYRTTGG
jgi:hypothetical protein